MSNHDSNFDLIKQFQIKLLIPQLVNKESTKSTCWTISNEPCARTLDFTPSFLVGCVLLICFLLWCPLQFPHKMMFGSSLTPVVCRRAHVLLTLFVFFSVYWCPTHSVLYFGFVVFVLSALCCNFLWIVHVCLPLRYSLTSMYSMSSQNFHLYHRSW